MQPEVALLRERGFALCKPAPGGKNPTDTGWTLQSLEVDSFGSGDQLGIIGGPISNGNKSGHALVILDLDSPAVSLLASEYLPATNMTDGRSNKPKTHRYFLVPLNSIPAWGRSHAAKTSKPYEERFGHSGPFTKSFRDRETNKEAIKFIGTGAQCVCPPALHHSGEVREWDKYDDDQIGPGQPAVVPFADLWRSTCELAAASNCNIPHVLPQQVQPIKKKLLPTLLERIHLYLAKCPPAVSGQLGHSQMFKTARYIIGGFDITSEEAFSILMREYNHRCVPPWSEKEMRHKVDDADSIPFDKERGWIKDKPLANRSKSTIQTPVPTKTDDGNSEEEPGGLVTTCLDTIKPEPIRWLVPDYIPLGKLVLLAGDGGHGKSFCTLHMAASLTTKRPCFGLDYQPPGFSEVLLISCEDDYGDTVVPRLLAMNANLKLIHRVDGILGKDGKIEGFSLAYYEKLAEELMINPRIRLVIIDPAGAYIGATGIDDHKDSELRSLLGPLSDIAAKHKTTIVLVKHLNKGVAAKAVNKVSGSAGYVNAVRSAYLIAPDPNDETELKKLFVPMKFNIARKPTGLKFHIAPLCVGDQDFILSRFTDIQGDDRDRLAAQLFTVEWDGFTSMSADKAVGSAPDKDKPSRVKDCADWLTSFLGDYAWPDSEVLAAAEDAGFGIGVVKRAKAQLREDSILSSRHDGPGTPWWNWMGNMRRPQRPRPYEPKKPRSEDNAPIPATGLVNNERMIPD
jgi:putative DNA primase/helicase